MWNLFKDIDTTKIESVKQFIIKLTEYGVDLIGIVCSLFIVIGGIQLTTASGNQEQAEKAKKTLTWAIVGLILVLGGKYFIDNFEKFIKS